MSPNGELTSAMCTNRASSSVCAMLLSAGLEEWAALEALPTSSRSCRNRPLSRLCSQTIFVVAFCMVIVVMSVSPIRARSCRVRSRSRTNAPCRVYLRQGGRGPAVLKSGSQSPKLRSSSTRQSPGSSPVQRRAFGERAVCGEQTIQNQKEREEQRPAHFQACARVSAQ